MLNIFAWIIKIFVGFFLLAVIVIIFFYVNLFPRLQQQQRQQQSHYFRPVINGQHFKIPRSYSGMGYYYDKDGPTNSVFLDVPFSRFNFSAPLPSDIAAPASFGVLLSGRHHTLYYLNYIDEQTGVKTAHGEIFQLKPDDPSYRAYPTKSELILAEDDPYYWLLCRKIMSVERPSCTAYIQEDKYDVKYSFDRRLLNDKDIIRRGIKNFVNSFKINTKTGEKQ